MIFKIFSSFAFPCVGRLVYVNLAPAKSRLGGSALAQCYSQIGDKSPDVDDPQVLLQAFSVIQNLIQSKALS